MTHQATSTHEGIRDDFSTTTLAAGMRVAMAVFILVLVLILSPLTEDVSQPIKFFTMQCAAFLFSVLLFVGSWWLDKPLRRPRLLSFLFLAYAMLITASALASAYPRHGLVWAASFASLVLLYLAASQIYTLPRHLTSLFLAACTAVAISSGYAFLQKTGHDPLTWAEQTSIEYKELPGSFGNPNYAGHAIVLCTLMALYLAGSRRNPVYLIFPVIYGIHLYFIGQRSVVLALAGAAVLVAIVFWIRRRNLPPVKAMTRAMGWTAAAGVLALCAVLLLLKTTTGYFFPLDSSLQSRYNSYFSAADMVLDHPWLGYGPGNYLIEQPAYWTNYERRSFASDRQMNPHVHNDVLESAVEGGLPASAIFLAIMVCAWGYGLIMAFGGNTPERRQAGLLFAAFFFAFFVDSLFGFNWRVPVSATLFFIVAGALEGIWRGPSHEMAAFGGKALIWRGTLVGGALFLVMFQAQVFASEVYLRKGKSLAAEGLPIDAREALAQAAILAPWDWRIPSEHGALTLELGFPGKALAYFNEALANNPYHFMALINSSAACLELGLDSRSGEVNPENETAGDLLTQAEDHAEKALALVPGLSTAEEIIARASAARARHAQRDADWGLTDRATVNEFWGRTEKYASDAIRHGTQHASLLYNLWAEARAWRGDVAGTETVLREAAERELANDRTWSLYHNLARQAAREASTADGSASNDTFNHLAALLRDGISRFREDKASGRELASLYVALARVQDEAFLDIEGAEATFERAVELAPAWGVAWAEFHDFSQRHERSASFRRVVQELSDKHANEPVGETLRTYLAALSQDPKELLTASEELAQSFAQAAPAADEEHSLAGWVAGQILDAARTAQVTGEERAVILLNLGLVMTRTNKLDAAAGLFAAAHPHLNLRDQSICVQNWAAVLARLGQYERAVTILEDMLDKTPTDLALRLTLAHAYKRLGRLDAAGSQYELILASPELTEEARRRILEELDTRPG